MATGGERSKLSRLERRSIEARAIAPLIDAVAEKVGRDEARALLAAVNENEAFERGRITAEEMGGNGIEELARDVAGWGHGGTMELDVLERTPTTLFFNVTRCPYFERYHELGLKDLGVALSCCRDEPFARGFNAKLRLERSKTLMEGADLCDFRYSLE